MNQLVDRINTIEVDLRTISMSSKDLSNFAWKEIENLTLNKYDFKRAMRMEETIKNNNNQIRDLNQNMQDVREQFQGELDHMKNEQIDPMHDVVKTLDNLII